MNAAAQIAFLRLFYLAHEETVLPALPFELGVTARKEDISSARKWNIEKFVAANPQAARNCSVCVKKGTG